MNLNLIRIVLVETSHPGNIGSTARAMKTMGLNNLYLVTPKVFPDSKAYAMATAADDLLDKAIVVDTLKAALHDCQIIIAASARVRGLSLPLLYPRDVASKVASLSDNTKVAIVFGREDSGLTNEEIAQSHYHVVIPSNPSCSSLNLSQAVQIIAYELYLQAISESIPTVKDYEHNYATANEIEQFYAHLKEVMLLVNFLRNSRPTKLLLQRIRRLFNRAHLEQEELSILRGFLSHIQYALQKNDLQFQEKNINTPESNNIATLQQNKFSKPIYLDYMATTPVDEQISKKMFSYLTKEGCFGNPASITHIYGQEALCAVEKARAQIANTIGATSKDIIFTSGATEANNLAILGAARFYQNNGRHLITMETEHLSVIDTFKQLETEGFQVTYLKPQPDGLLNLDVLAKSLTNETILVSIMHANNEIGVIQDLTAISKIVHAHGSLLHVDAAQSAGKIAINLNKIAIDLMSLSAHKNYGPKGIGALYVRHKPRIRLQPISFGGNQEMGLRSGTLATHQIVGMGEAFAISYNVMASEQQRILYLRNTLWEGIKHLPGIQLNGHPIKRLAGNLNVSFAGIDGDDLLIALNKLAISTTSACAAAKTQSSHVLISIGLNNNLAQSSIRLSFGRFTTMEEIADAVAIICNAVASLHKNKCN